MENITFIGMAGVGKSFFGKKLAEKYNYKYIEVDRIITEEAEKLGLNKEIVSDDVFISLEEKAVFSISDCKNATIDTGGSVVYSEKGMDLLKSISKVVYLKDNVENIRERFDKRGEPHLIGIEGKTFEQLYLERDQLYKKYADLMIDVSQNRNADEILKMILR